VRTNLSAKQFARGQRGGILTTPDAHIGEDGVEGRGELTSPILHEEPELHEATAKIHH
jgi:hypothetical protein